ncbi:MAG TPA: hypothetical protein VF796_24910, partial [Humisphaera sp.]
MTRTHARSTKTTKATRTAAFETLEGRQLMSVSPYVVNGTNGNDVITVNYGLNLTVAPTILKTAAT